jgi:hypothetical protein
VINFQKVALRNNPIIFFCQAIEFMLMEVDLFFELQASKTFDMYDFDLGIYFLIHILNFLLKFNDFIIHVSFSLLKVINFVLELSIDFRLL